jgi:hypothetical protein
MPLTSSGRFDGKKSFDDDKCEWECEVEGLRCGVVGRKAAGGRK